MDVNWLADSFLLVPSLLANHGGYLSCYFSLLTYPSPWGYCSSLGRAALTLDTMSQGEIQLFTGPGSRNSMTLPPRVGASEAALPGKLSGWLPNGYLFSYLSKPWSYGMGYQGETRY